MTSCPASTKAPTDNKFFCTGATVVFATVFSTGPSSTKNLFSQKNSDAISHGFLRSMLCEKVARCVRWNHVYSSPESSPPNVTVLKWQFDAFACPPRENKTTDLQSWFQIQVQVAVHPVVARCRSSHLQWSHLHPQLRCFCSLVQSDHIFHIPAVDRVLSHRKALPTSTILAACSPNCSSVTINLATNNAAANDGVFLGMCLEVDGYE